ncbi:MAG: hypothetical protein MKZ95_16565, partial [Pirellulales bacterium]|nr:hypothetical protein [Pirellulales bacterium]
FPYGTRCLLFDNFFLNVANWENGKNWSTPWVVDDPQFFVIPPEGKTLASLIRKKSNFLARDRAPTRSTSKPTSWFKKAWKR